MVILQFFQNPLVNRRRHAHVRQRRISVGREQGSDFSAQIAQRKGYPGDSHDQYSVFADTAGSFVVLPLISDSLISVSDRI